MVASKEYTPAVGYFRKLILTSSSEAGLKLQLRKEWCL